MAKNITFPRFRATRLSGAPGNGWKLYSYAAGTTTLKATYTDQTGITANANPLILDGAGEGSVWLTTGGYKFVLADENDVVQWTVDGLNVPDAGEFSTITVTGAATLAAITASGPFTSNVAAGTAPFVVTSSTLVALLNVAQLLGKTWAVPDPIGPTTPNTGKFTTLEATSTSTQTGDVTQSANQTRKSANAAEWKQGQLSEEITLSTAGVTTDSVADLLPANSIMEAVVARVTQTITTATDWKLGDATQAGRFLAAQSGAQLTLGATAVGLAHADPTVATANLGPVQTAAAKLRITTTGTPGAGKIRITTFFRTFVAPTS